MGDIDRHEAGRFCWIELATTDPDAAKGFYGELFGWAKRDDEIPGGGVYTTALLRGRSVAAIASQQPDEKAMGIPPHWNTYVAVESADETARAIEAAGGKILAPPFDVMEFGRMAVFADPGGAVLSLWQPKAHVGAQVVDEPGALCWVELATNDVGAAAKFYTAVFPWSTKPSPEYTELYVGPHAVGGMMAIRPEWGPVPPNWMPYFAAADVDALAERAKRLGGGVRMPPGDIPNVGRFAVLHDGQGATFAVYKTARG